MRGFTHSAHLNEIKVVVDQIVKAGEQIGTLGSTGSSTSAHCHFEAWKIDPRILGTNWQNRYTTGLTMAQVEDRYYNPVDYLKDKVFPVLGGYRANGGYVFGQVNADGQIHPGDDLNAGPGNSDIGTPILACEDSEVIGVFDTATGFGKHVFLRALNEEESNQLNEESMIREEFDTFKKDTEEKLSYLNDQLTNGGFVKQPVEDVLIYKNTTGKLSLFERIDGVSQRYQEISGLRNMTLWLIKKFFGTHLVKEKPESVVKKFSL
jgi:hypothetical protein